MPGPLYLAGRNGSYVFNDPSAAVPRQVVAQAEHQILLPVREVAGSTRRVSVCHRHFCRVLLARRWHWRFPLRQSRHRGSYPMQQTEVLAVVDDAADLQGVPHSEAAFGRWKLSCRNPAP
jgi:hypothetical protein